jgi:hypothetical protein
MQEQTKVQENLRLWLLGLLSQEQSESLEQRLITDNRVFDEISVVEDELIDEYLSDELSERERGAFESFFMNSLERERQFKVGKAWRNYIEREDPFGKRQSDSTTQNLPTFAKQQPSFLASLGAYRIPLAATLLILVAGIVWIDRWSSFLNRQFRRVKVGACRKSSSLATPKLLNYTPSSRKANLRAIERPYLMRTATTSSPSTSLRSIHPEVKLMS